MQKRLKRSDNHAPEVDGQNPVPAGLSTACLKNEGAESHQCHDNPDPLDYKNAMHCAQEYVDNNNSAEAVGLYQRLSEAYPRDIPLLLAWGNALYILKKYAGAAVIFKRIIAAKPERVEGWNNLGIVQIAGEDYEGAKASFEMVLTLEVENHGALLNLGNYYMLMGKVDKAIELFDRAVAARHDFPDAWYNLGNAFLKKEAWDKALSHFEKALRYNPEHHSAIKNMGFAYEKSDDPDKAEQCYRKALELNTGDVGLYVNLALVYKRQGNLDKAKHNFLIAIRLAPNDSSAWLGLRDLALVKGDITTYVKSTIAIIHRLESETIAETMQILRGVQQYNHLLTVCAAADRLKKKGSELDAERMLMHLRSEKVKVRAVTLYKKLYTLGNPSDHILLCLAEYCVAISDFDTAFKYLEKVSSKDRTYNTVLMNTLLGKNDLPLLKKNIDSYLEDNRDDSEAWYMRAKLCSMQSDIEGAEKYLKRALETGFTKMDSIEGDAELKKIYGRLVDPMLFK